MLLDCRYGCRSCPPSFEPAESYSGKSQLRAPKPLYRRLAERAKREGVSLNTLAVTLLEEGLGERTAIDTGCPISGPITPRRMHRPCLCLIRFLLRFLFWGSTPARFCAVIDAFGRYRMTGR
jgi:hypothetical protein